MRTIFTSFILLLVLTLSTSAQSSGDVRVSDAKENITVIDFFTVTCNEKIWDIKWKAISEFENCNYIIEYSFDQQTWIPFKYVEGTANTTGVYTYSTYMKRTSDSICLFRLKYDCTSTLQYYKSPVANLCPDYIPESTTLFVIEYNNSNIQIGSNVRNNGPYQVFVYSVLGQLLFKTELIDNSTNGKIDVPYQLKNNEVVIVKVSNGKNTFSKKIYIP